LEKVNKYFLLNKPFNLLSQFTDELGRRNLGEFNFPPNVYSVGRLDYDSEGLLFLTDDRTLTDKILNPKFKHEKEYLVQVEGIPSSDELMLLEAGVVIEGKKTLPAKIKLIESPIVWERRPPIRDRKNIPTAWLSITITEGRKRQIRKMTAAIGHPTLRLIRIRFMNLVLADLPNGKFRELSEEEITQLKNKL